MINETQMLPASTASGILKIFPRPPLLKVFFELEHFSLHLVPETQEPYDNQEATISLPQDKNYHKKLHLV